MKAPSREANRTLILLVISIAINYIDRGALSISAPLIAREMSLSPAQMGLLFSAFFWTYSALQPLAGWCVDRYNVNSILAGGYLLWSLATASVTWITRFGFLFGARLVLGAGESVAYPAYSKILTENFPENRRGFANAQVDAASKVGPALSTLIGGLLISRFGWRSLFLGLGLVSLIWLLPWIRWAPPSSRRTGKSAEARPGALQVLRQRETWGTSIGMFALGYAWTFLISWLPTYLINERGLSMRSVAVLGSLPFWAMAATSMIGGWWSDRWIAAGGGVTKVRKTFVAGGMLLCCVTLLPAAVVRTPQVSAALLVVSCSALGFFTSNVWAITQTLAGPLAAGSWTGIQNAVGNLGGVLSPALTGIIVSSTGSYVIPFAVSSGVLFIGMLSYFTLVGEIRELRWSENASHG